MREVKAARERLEKLLQGRYVPKRLTPEEAKRRLLDADPGIDISDVLKALQEGDAAKAAQNLLYQSFAPEAIAFFSPLVASALQGFIAAAKHPETSDENPI
ncbi:hypothetical protein [Hydrogenimonas sp.]